jgi:hypothetical protein
MRRKPSTSIRTREELRVEFAGATPGRWRSGVVVALLCKMHACTMRPANPYIREICIEP